MTRANRTPHVRWFRTLLAGLAAALVCLGPAAASAQELTGAIEGVVRDSSGAILPGATVEATGPAGVVTTVSDERGEYRFPRLPSGRYRVVATLSGFSPKESPVDLTVGVTARTDFALGVGGLAEAVQVTSETPVIDHKSAATSTSIARERIELLPRGRDFTDVVSQAAGANNESQAGGISIDGSSGSENRFVIDGIDTTSPQEGVNALPLRADLVEEVQVKSAGYSAEFGGSTGGVINVITKSGSNQFRGSVGAEFEQRSWGGSERPLLRDSLTSNTSFVYVNPGKDDESRVDPTFTIGGPILRNRLWFFGAYQPGIRSTDRTVTFTNGTTNTFNQDFRVDYGTVNATGNAGSELLFRGGGNFSSYETKGSLPGQDGRTSLTSPDDYRRGTIGTRFTYSGSVDYVPGSRFVVSGRLGRFLTDEESTNVNFPGLIHNFSTASTPAGLAALPDPFRRIAGFTSDVLILDATARDEYIRDHIGVDATYYATAFGEHTIKGGFQTEQISNDVQSGYNADRILYYAGRTYTTTNAQVVTGRYGYFRLLNISTLGAVKSRNNALFIQDTWRVTPRLTVNAGLRTERERIPNFGIVGPESAIEFSWGEKLAPRLGFVLDPLGNQQWKIYGSFGKYYDVMKYELPRGSFGGDKWVDYFFLWDSPDWSTNAAGCATGTNTINQRPTCAAGAFIEAVDRRFNAADPSDPTVDPNLKPMENNEYQLGVERDLGRRMVVGARYIRKNLVRAIEDVGVIVPGIGEVFYIANPGEGISRSLADPGVPSFPKAVRDYDAIELTFQRRYANDWSMYANYTWSRLYGNYSGLASSDENGRTSPNVNRFFDHIENTFDRNGDPVFGRLGTDRPHQLKAAVIYRFRSDTTLGVNQRIASGIPVSGEANVAATVPFFPFGRGNLGRTPVFSQTDLEVNQDFRFSRYAVNLSLTVLNLFDQDTVTRRYRSQTVGSLPLSTTAFFAGNWDYDALLAANPSLLDVKFNQPDQYQAPRQMRVAVKFQF